MTNRGKQAIFEDMREWHDRWKEPIFNEAASDLRLSNIILKNGNTAKQTPENVDTLLELNKQITLAHYKFEHLYNGILLGIARAIDLCHENKFADAQETLEVIRGFVWEVGDPFASEIKEHLQNSQNLVYHL